VLLCSCATRQALPILEELDLPYASRTPGRMHACGHDFHMSALLGAAK
jgi:metal-dependent amidase/aminoacylase/carboxypeptidase family protein